MKPFIRIACQLVTLPLLAQVPASLAADAAKLSDEQKTFYFLGGVLARNLEQFALSPEELELVVQGVRDTVGGTAIPLDEQTYMQRAGALSQERLAAAAAVESAAADKYLAEMAAEDGATTTESGIVILELVEGSGAAATSTSTVKAHYHGTLRDGTVFDSSVERGEPLEISLGSVIPCWTEAVATMQEGDKAKISCPPALAYGNQPQGAIPPGSALTFEVELIEVIN